MIEAREHERIAFGLMRAALAELAKGDRAEPAVLLQRAIDTLAPAIGNELAPELAALVAAMPLPNLPRQALPPEPS